MLLLADRASAQSVAALDPAVAQQYGATVPFLEYEAEDAVTNGAIIGADRTFSTLAAEVSGRRAVRLDRVRQFVEFTLAKPANAVTIRYPNPAPAGRVPATGRSAGVQKPLATVVIDEL